MGFELGLWLGFGSQSLSGLGLGLELGLGLGLGLGCRANQHGFTKILPVTFVRRLHTQREGHEVL